MPTKRSESLHVALTGTPGVGKTTLSTLAAEAGWRVVDVKAWAKEQDCVVAFDDEDQAMVVDMDQLATCMPQGGRILFEGHLSHLLPVQAAWVIRCDPLVLADRLKARGYSKAKIMENLEAEALDLILQEALDLVPVVIERDGTHRTPTALFKSFSEVPIGKTKRHDLDGVDWSDRLPIRMT
jgi:adenylate kinase